MNLIMAILFVLCTVPCVAQEARYIDLASSDYSSDGTIVWANNAVSASCDRTGDSNSLDVSLVSLDQQSIEYGGELGFTVRVRNVTRQTLRIPFSPDPNEVLPTNPEKPFVYATAEFGLMLQENGPRKNPVIVHSRTLYGADSEPWAYQEIRPGEWITVRNSGKVLGDPNFMKDLRKMGILTLQVIPSFITTERTYKPHDEKDQNKSSTFSRCWPYVEYGNQSAQVSLVWPAKSRQEH